MAKTTIVILNWNGRKYLELFLPGVIRHSQEHAEVIIADNASDDDSIDFLENNYPQLRVIQLDKNYGFAEGYNRALKEIDADYYVLLNSDIDIRGEWIPPVVELMESDPVIAACQPKIRSYHEPGKFEYAGAAGGYIDKYGYPFCRGRIFQMIEDDSGQYNDPEEIFWATGACMFVRSSAFHEMRGLDADFFAHMEEIDFCWRLKNNGYKVMFCPESVVFHIGGGTLPKNNARKTYLNIRNNIIMLYKNLPTRRLFPVFFVRMFLDGIASVKFLVDGGFKDMFSVVKAHWHFMFHFRRYRRKRERIKHRHVSKIYDGSIVFAHYLHQKSRFTELDRDKFTD